MTVGELIEELNKYPKDLDVVNVEFDDVVSVRRTTGVYNVDGDEYNFDKVVIHAY